MPRTSLDDARSSAMRVQRLARALRSAEQGAYLSALVGEIRDRREAVAVMRALTRGAHWRSLTSGEVRALAAVARRHDPTVAGVAPRLAASRTSNLRAMALTGEPALLEVVSTAFKKNSSWVTDDVVAVIVSAALAPNDHFGTQYAIAGLLEHVQLSGETLRQVAERDIRVSALAILEPATAEIVELQTGAVDPITLTGVHAQFAASLDPGSVAGHWYAQVAVDGITGRTSDPRLLEHFHDCVCTHHLEAGRNARAAHLATFTTAQVVRATCGPQSPSELARGALELLVPEGGVAVDVAVAMLADFDGTMSELAAAAREATTAPGSATTEPG